MLPDVVYTARKHIPSPGRPEGALIYVRSADENDCLAYVDVTRHLRLALAMAAAASCLRLCSRQRFSKIRTLFARRETR